MKTRHFLLAAAALTLAACSGEEIADSGGFVELRLASAIEPQTRSAADTQGETLAAEEKVYAWVDNAGTGASHYPSFTLTSDGQDGFSDCPVMYFPQSGDNVNVYGLHGDLTDPPAEGSGFPTGGIAFSVAERQDEIGGDAYISSDLLYAAELDVDPSGHRNVDVELGFYHMLSKLELAIKLEGDTPELAAENAIYLSDMATDGIFTPDKTIDPSSAEERAKMVEASDNTSMRMTLGQETCADFTEENIVYNEAVIVPQDMSGKVLSFNLSDGRTLAYAFPEGTVFESGKKYRYHITVSMTQVGLEGCTVSDWKANEEDSVTESLELERNTVNLASLTGNLTITKNTVLTGTATRAVTININEGASYIVFNNANFADNSQIIVNTTATINLSGENTISTSNDRTPAITVTGGTEGDEHTLTITGSDSDKLEIKTTGYSSACIQSANGYSHINIEGGTIKANTQDYFSTAIGGGNGEASGNIIISGGTVTATTEGHNSTAIGGGNGGTSDNITISGGTVTATTNGDFSTAIGGGNRGTSGDITISGGTVTATTKGNNSTAIGGGNLGTSGDIIIRGGTVTAATNGNNSTAIGGGNLGNSGNISISGGTVTATAKGYSSVAIGGGHMAKAGNITITGGEVIAESNDEFAAAIGGTSSGSCENILITGSETKVTATSSDSCTYDIGPGGTYYTCGTVTVSDGATVQRKDGSTARYPR